MDKDNPGTEMEFHVILHLAERLRARINVGMSYSRNKAPTLERVDKKRRFYLLHGDDEAAIELAKTRVVDAHVSREEREENYREVIPNQQPLKRVLGDLLSELSTVSFLPGVNRVVTLYTVSDFFEARAAKRGSRTKKEAEVGKATASDHLLDFIKRELPNLPAVLIVIALEDYEKFKKVNSKNAVVEFAQSNGAAYVFKENSPQFAFFDALFARKTVQAITLWRDWVSRNPASPKPYMQLVAQLRLLIQAKTVSSGQLQSRGISKAQFSDEFLPKDWDKNFYALRPDFRQEKLLKAAASFTFGELLSAYEKLMDIQKYAIPMGSDVYVPDKTLLSELWIAEFTSNKQ